MTIYELTHDSTVQGNIRISAFDKDGEEMVLMERRDVDDLQMDTSEAYEDCDILYLFCSRDGFLHIEIEAPKYVRVKEEYADDWTGGYYDDPDDHEVTIDFWKLKNLAGDWDKTVEELLEQCEAY